MLCRQLQQLNLQVLRQRCCYPKYLFFALSSAFLSSLLTSFTLKILLGFLKAVVDDGVDDLLIISDSFDAKYKVKKIAPVIRPAVNSLLLSLFGLHIIKAVEVIGPSLS